MELPDEIKSHCQQIINVVKGLIFSGNHTTSSPGTTRDAAMANATASQKLNEHPYKKTANSISGHPRRTAFAGVIVGSGVCTHTGALAYVLCRYSLPSAYWVAWVDSFQPYNGIGHTFAIIGLGNAPRTSDEVSPHECWVIDPWPPASTPIKFSEHMSAARLETFFQEHPTYLNDKYMQKEKRKESTQLAGISFRAVKQCKPEKGISWCNKSVYTQIHTMISKMPGGNYPLPDLHEARDAKTRIAVKLLEPYAPDSDDETDDDSE